MVLTSRKGSIKSKKSDNSVTLHNFFSKPLPTLAIPSKKTANQENHLKSVPTYQEVIIIDDSDSELEIVVPIKKRRRASHDSSDVEVIGAVVKRSCSHPASSTSSPCNPGAFGSPKTLLLPKASLSEPRALSSYVAPVETDGGESTTMRSITSTDITEPSRAPPKVAVPREAYSTPPENDISIDFFIADEWSTGDDEVQIVDEDEETREKRPQTPPSLSSKPLSSLKSNPDAFAILMSSRKEDFAQKESGDARKSNGSKHKTPFYKVLQGMSIAVDAFKYGAIPKVSAYFLTHAHSDHYTNLSSSWTNGPIFCSEGTANLIIHMLRVPRKHVHPLPMDTPTIIPNTGGVSVTLIEANHCPGSCLFLFEGKQTIDSGDNLYPSPFIGSSRVFRYLHCGDFRASPKHVLHPAIKGKRIDTIYLDTTYLEPRYTFPPQSLVISACAALSEKLATGNPVASGPTPTVASWFKGEKQTKEQNILFIVGTYSIGKERIVKAVAKQLGSKVYCDARKIAILRCEADPELDSLLTTKPLEARVHLVPLGGLTSDKLLPYLDQFQGHFTAAIGFRPTGWTYSQPYGTDSNPNIQNIISRCQKQTYGTADLTMTRNSSAKVKIYAVPYSEHSSFFELTCFAMSVNWDKMIATVNVGSEVSREKMRKWFDRWKNDRKKLADGSITIVPYRDEEFW